MSLWLINSLASNVVNNGNKGNTGNTGSSGSTGTTGGITTSSSAATPIPSATNIAALGCYNDVPGRALLPIFTDVPSMTIDQCAQIAQNANLQYFGLEYKTQCLAGSDLNSGSKSGSTGCGMACGGNSKQICGGGNAISLYNNTQWIKPFNPNPVSIPNSANTFTYVGCYNESTYSRALTGSSSTSTSMSVEACANFCNTKSATWMGLENANQCFCGTQAPMNGAVLSPNGDADCNSVCAGSNAENCGAPNKLNVYQLKTGRGNAKVVVDAILIKPGSTTLKTTTSAKVSSKTTTTTKTTTKPIATPVKSTLVGKRGLYRVW
jgi:hypothetical protein